MNLRHLKLPPRLPSRKSLVVIVLLFSLVFLLFALCFNLGKDLFWTGGLATVDKPLATSPLVFVGDVMLGRNVEVLMNRHGLEYPFINLPLIFDKAEYVIGNFEASMPVPHTPTPAYQMRFSVDKKFLPQIKEFGFTHLSLANNHTYDYGEVGYEGAKSNLTKNNLVAFGHPDNVDDLVTYISSGPFTIAVLAVHDVYMAANYSHISKIIEETRDRSDYQVLYIHWGEEYKLLHNDYQQYIAHKMIDDGIDAVVGHHPHVVQDIEVYKGKPIFYSLGNFIFDQYFSVDVGQGLVLNMSLDHKQVIFEFIPITNDTNLSQPTLMQSDQKQQFLNSLARRSSPEIADYIKSGKLILPLELAKQE